MEFERDGHHFRCEKLSALQQLHLSRKIAPLLPPLAPLLMQFWAHREDEDGWLAQDLGMLGMLAEPLARELANMKDADAEAVLEMTLTSVKVETAPGTWIPLWIHGGRAAAVIEFNDISKLLPLVVKVVMFNLGSFTDGLLTRRGAPEQGSPTSNGPGSPGAKTGR